MIQQVAILGAGVMGQGIAHAAGIAGFDVLLFDINENAVDDALSKIEQNLQKGVDRGKLDAEQKEETLARIGGCNDLKALDSDLIIEAIVEDLSIKRELLSEVQLLLPAAIIASNTSTLPITRIAKGLQDPGKVVGMHFFNPAFLMKLVEVIRGVETSDETFDAALEFVKKLGKTGVEVKDSPGFIVNRVARPYYTESLRVLEDGSDSVEAVDKLLEATGFRMGPFRLMDLIGVDTNFAVTTNMFEQFYGEARFRPSRIQKEMVDAGMNGKKNGKGFYDYSE